jgi:FkbM family methyltransferase
MIRSPGTSLVNASRRRSARALHILKTQGPASLLWDAAMVGLKPARARCESLLWRYRRTATDDALLKARVQGSRMYLNPDDVGISRELAIYRVHEPLSTRVLRQIAVKGMTVIDIGANIGYYALIESQGVGESGRVIAIEPVDSNYELLVKNVRENACANVTTMQIAIGDYIGVARMYLAKRSNCHSIIRRGASDNYSEVEITTIDKLVENLNLTSVDLLRMDIEGYEFKAIDGMIGTIRAHRPAIFLELHPHVKGVEDGACPRFIQRLKDLGYDVQYVIDRARDVPVRDWMAPIERMSIDDLLRDSRITTDRRPISVLFRARESWRASPSDD